MPTEVWIVVQFNNGVESCPVESYPVDERYPVVGKDAQGPVESCPMDNVHFRDAADSLGPPMLGIDAHAHRRVENCPVHYCQCLICVKTTTTTNANKRNMSHLLFFFFIHCTFAKV